MPCAWVANHHVPYRRHLRPCTWGRVKRLDAMPSSARLGDAPANEIELDP